MRTSFLRTAILSSGVLLASTSFAAISKVSLNMEGAKFSGLNQISLKEELKAQHPELDVEAMNLVGLEVTGRVDGEDFNKFPLPISNTKDWTMETDGQVELQEVVLNLEGAELIPAKSGAVVIRRGGYVGPVYRGDRYRGDRYRGGWDRPGYRNRCASEPWLCRRDRPRNDYNPRPPRRDWNPGPRRGYRPGPDRRGPRVVLPDYSQSQATAPASATL